MYDLIIRDATIIRSTRRLVADIAIEDGRIAFVGASAEGPAREEVSGIGRFVIPGLIDTQVACRAPGDLSRHAWGPATRAAVASGVTSVLDLPLPSDPVLTAQDVSALLESAATESVANYGVWAHASPEHQAEAFEMWSAGTICAPHICMDQTEGPLGFSPEQLRAYIAAAPGLVGVHAEDPTILTQAARKWAEVEDPVHNDVRPNKAAIAATQQLLALVRELDKPVHITSMSTAGELNTLDPYRGDVPITSAIAPAHLFLSIETAQKLGNAIKMDPPVRTELDRRALWAAVKRGRIDVFTSAHVPRARPGAHDDYWQMASGIPGVNLLFPLLISSVKHGRMGLERFVAMCCEAPAQVFGLQGKGVIEEGADADLVLFHEGTTARLRKPRATSDVGWTPYLGREVGQAPELVVVQGRIVARDGELAEDLQPGSALRYQR